MKKITLSLVVLGFSMISFAQNSTDQTTTENAPKLGFFKLIVKNQDIVETFYKETFGFERARHVDLPTFEERVLRLPSSKISLVLYSHKDGREIKVGNGHGPVGIVTSEVDKLHAKALTNGAKEKLAPMNFGSTRLSFLFDPEGHEVELINLSGAQPAAPKGELKKRWTERIESGKAYTSEEMMSDFLELEAISIEEILGMWYGGKFDGGTAPDLIKWYGKKFISKEHVEPLMVKAPDGSIVPFTKLGSARLRDVFFKNKTSATIIYNEKPILDYFRKIDDDTIIGWGEIKGETPDFFFWLKRESADK